MVAKSKTAKGQRASTKRVAKRAKPKTTAKKAAKKRAASTKSTAKKPAAKKPAKKPAAKKQAPATRKTATARRGSTHAAAPAAARSQVDSQPTELNDDVATSTEPAAKKGPFARFAGGVGNLIARMTSKKEPEQPDPDQTIELAAGDILTEADAPPPIPSTKPKAE